ncbi:triadin-like [Phacochoerus africanus]|uniref:triadin-like n=1 Tax=Phacochoerus africanus TaxID=41426 RepID=UPI001FDA63E8|nr:triadin-like [Phacochoerus africanus]
MSPDSKCLLTRGRFEKQLNQNKKEDAKKKTEKEIATDVKKKEPGKAPETKQGTIKVAAQDLKKTKTPTEELPKGKTKSPKKEHSAPSEKQVKAKTERAKEEVGAASTKKVVEPANLTILNMAEVFASLPNSVESTTQEIPDVAEALTILMPQVVVPMIKTAEAQMTPEAQQQ